MDAHSLLQKVQKDHVSNPNLGTNVEIEYTHKDGTLEPILRAFVSIETVRSDTTKERHDEVTFSSLVLTLPPHRRDFVTYDGSEFVVDSWMRDGDLYDVTTISNEAYKVRR